MNEIQVLLPAARIPDGAQVSKLGGHVIYKLVRKITLNSQGGDGQPASQQIISANGTVYLFNGDSGNIGSYPDTHKFMWHTDEEELLEHLRSTHEGEAA